VLTVEAVKLANYRRTTHKSEVLPSPPLDGGRSEIAYPTCVFTGDEERCYWGLGTYRVHRAPRCGAKGKSDITPTSVAT
jgi:hypothetical protein